MMDIEAIVKKYAARYRWSATGTTVKAMLDAAIAKERQS